MGGMGFLYGRFWEGWESWELWESWEPFMQLSDSSFFTLPSSFLLPLGRLGGAPSLHHIFLYHEVVYDEVLSFLGVLAHVVFEELLHLVGLV